MDDIQLICKHPFQERRTDIHWQCMVCGKTIREGDEDCLRSIRQKNRGLSRS